MRSSSTAVDKPHEEYFAHLAQGRFMIQHSPSTGQYVFYPRVAAPKTGGKGTVYATTTMRPRPPQPPYNVSLIELAEGPRMMSRVEGVDAGDVKIGMAVTARIATEEDGPVVVFDVDPS